jgi:hypothetical protein
MNDESDYKPTHRPRAGAKLETLGYHLRVVFHPEIRLEQKRGWDFGRTLTEFIQPNKSELQAEAWTFSQPQGGSPNCFLSVNVRPSDIQLNVSQPVNNKEWYETRYGLLLRRFAEFFTPELILESSAMIHGLLPIDGDARTFLAQHVMNMNPSRTDQFGRPIHLVGLRFFFPPFRKKGKKGKEAVTDWQVNVKAESWLEDPGKLYLEADADWPSPEKWTETAVNRALERLNTVGEYLEKNVVAFLQHRPDEQTGDEE